MTLGDIDTNLRDEGVGGSELRKSERRNRELADAQKADAELSDTHHATCKLADRDDAACRNWSSVRAVLERDVHERQTCNGESGFVLVAKAVPSIPCWIRSPAPRARERLFRDLVSALAARLHPLLSTRLSVFERYESLRVGWPRVIGARANQTVVRVLLEHVRAPAGNAADGEDRRVEINRDA